MDGPPLDAATQLAVGRFILDALGARDLVGILVGTNAAVARGVMTTLSKDSDVIVVGYRSPAQVRSAVKDIAVAHGLTFKEQSWGVLTVRKPGEGNPPRTLWAADIILPSSGMIPRRAAYNGPWACGRSPPGQDIQERLIERPGNRAPGGSYLADRSSSDSGNPCPRGPGVGL